MMTDPASSPTHPSQGARAAALTPPHLVRRSKNIVLFSDGTGNSSAKLFRTNVWRTYEAVDLGPAAPGKIEQIAYYDNGVGTSQFRPFALLGGLFGFGLKQNVLDLYRYACRNYQPHSTDQSGSADGDHIYGFGFSRGAFTMRVLIALIADQGLVPYKNELDLERRSAAAYRAFRPFKAPRYWFAPARLVTWAVRAITTGWRSALRQNDYDPSNNHRPVIKFVGVWDTVAAYGGPIAELTRAIDNWLFRLSMPNFKLDPAVRKARHALALDDERDAFQPLLWDETHELELITRKNIGKEPLGDWINENRLDQVWFAGMHSDVGGGYPDESLSYVSLLWMLEEAETAGLRTLNVITDRYRALANSFGPMHDSRSGLAAYYRYQPRNITAWTKPTEGKGPLSLQDPSIQKIEGDRGLLTQVKVHESVLARIASGTDSYAPIGLPESFLVFPPGRHAENQPQADSDPGGQPAEPTSPHLVPFELRSRLNSASVQSELYSNLKTAWDRVWLRRVAYFTTLFATLALVALPLLVGSLLPEAPFLSDGRNVAQNVVGLLRAILPDFLDGWFAVLERNSFYALVFLAAIIASMFWGKRIEASLRDKAHQAWCQATGAATEISKKDPSYAFSIIRNLRESRLYQRTIQVAKWHILPFFVGLGIVVVMIWLALGTLTQLALPKLERDGREFCQATGAPKPLTTKAIDFATNKLCVPTGVTVKEGETYEISFVITSDWRDGKLDATPTGLGASSAKLGFGYFGVPFRRVLNANYLQPIMHIRPVKRPGLTGAIYDNVFLYPLRLQGPGDDVPAYRGRFKARRTGELSIFVNDAILPPPFDSKFFYEDRQSDSFRANDGTACILLKKVSETRRETPIAVTTPMCQIAAKEVLRLEALKQKAASGTRTRDYLIF